MSDPKPVRLTCKDCGFHSDDEDELVDHIQQEGHLLTEGPIDE